MTAQLGDVVDRIARATSSLRVRAVEAERAHHNGGSSADLSDRIVEAVERLEKVADELEAVLNA